MSNKNIPPHLDTRPLRYINEALRQIVRTLRDFGLDDTAQLLEKACVDIEAALPKQQSEVERR